jgi:exportin-5
MLSSFEGFCQLLGVEGVCPYLQARDVQNIDDWSTIVLDDEGKNIQAHITAKFQVFPHDVMFLVSLLADFLKQLPLRGTKTMLAVSTDKLKRTDPAYQIACELWCETIPLILPTLLQLVR